MEIRIIENENFSPTGERLPILTYPEPVLRQVAQEVTKFDEELKVLAQNMLLTMYNAPGIGLAAPQVGVSTRLLVLDVHYESEEITAADDSEIRELSNFNPLVIINPKIVKHEGTIEYQEGCLSLPTVYENIDRHEKITLEYQNLDGETLTLEADGLLSICIQHEMDHLDGIVFLDKLSNLKKQFYTKKLIKYKKQR